MLRRTWQFRCAAEGAVLSIDKCREALATFKSARTKTNLVAGQTLLRDAFWPEGQMLPIQDACDVIQAAAAFKPDLTAGKSRAVTAAVESIERVPETLTPAQYAAAFSGVTALHHPKQFDVMLRHMHRVGSAEVVSQMTLEHLSSITSAMGRSGTRHEDVIAALADRAAELMPEATNVAHVANIAYAFAHTQLPASAPVWDVTAQASTRLVDQSVPLITATLLNAFSTSWGSAENPKDITLSHPRAVAVETLERSASSRVSELPPALSSSLALSLARFGRVDFVDKAHDRMVATVSTFAPAHVADVFRALLILKHNHTELMGVLAERAAADIRRYKVKDVAAVLQTLAHFDLFDAQLTDLAIQQVLATLKARSVVDINVLAAFLRALAASGTRNHVVISAIQRLAADTPEAVTAEGASNLRTALQTFGVKPSPQLQARLDRFQATESQSATA